LFCSCIHDLTFLLREQLQNARDNPLAAAAAAAVDGTAAPQQQSNVENLLDIDFDGTAPASAHKEPNGGMSGLEGLAGTPVRIESPAAGAPAPSGSNNLDDLLGVFGDTPAPTASTAASPTGGAGADLLNGFGGLDLSGDGMSSPPPAGASQPKKTNEDILSLF
jgi:hypothetical protein